MKEILALLSGKCCTTFEMTLMMMAMTVQIMILAMIMIFNYLGRNRIVREVRAQIRKLHVTELIKTKILLSYPTPNLSLKNQK